MQAVGVTAIENMKMVKVPKIVFDKILLYLSAKSNALPTFGFVRKIKSIIKSFSHSLKSNPNIISDKNDHMHRGDLKITFFLLNRFKLVLNVTYITWLHNCK